MNKIKQTATRKRGISRRPLIGGTIVGGGIIGLATAMKWQLAEPSRNVVLVEAEAKLAAHQSGHNSGVIHSGIYYRPGSEKAILCRRGKQQLEEFCIKRGVPWEKCGKVIVATKQDELESLESIADHARQNGVEFERINTDQLRRLEPAAAGIAAIHVPETGIVNYTSVCRAMAARFVESGGEIRLSKRVSRIDYLDQAVCLGFGDGSEILSDQVIVCGGLHSDRLYAMAAQAAGETEPMAVQGDGLPVPELALDQSEIQIVPFRGEYYDLVPERRQLCRNLIYPVPDPRYPFLGVHFTRMVGEGDTVSDGGVECGPNAVLAFARHGYRWRDFNARDFVSTIGFEGFRRLAQEHWRMGIGEFNRSIRKEAFVGALQRLIPEIRSADLVAARAGVRAQAVRADGSLVDDFLFRQTPRMTHVINAPSPAATASLAIADRILEVHRELENASSMG